MSRNYFIFYTHTRKLFAMGGASFQLYMITLHLLVCNYSNAITGYTRRPLDGYYCRTGVYKDIGSFDQQACTRSCIKAENCVLLMYNPHNRMCLHLDGSRPCHQATPSPEIMIMRFRPSLKEQCLIPSKPPNDRLIQTEIGYPRVVTQKYQNGVVCLGVSNIDGDNRFNFEGHSTAVDCPDVPMERMAVDPFCTVAWVTYTAGDVLPRGAIVMGYWNGKPSYSTRHTYGSQQSFGWYLGGSDVATAQYYGRNTDSVFDILISV